jgi:hypothetical protein
MKKEEFRELCDLSLLALGHKYAWKKLRNKGLAHERKAVGRGFIARRMPLTVEGVKHYLKTTLDMQSKLQKELEEKKNEQGRD